MSPSLQFKVTADGCCVGVVEAREAVASAADDFVNEELATGLKARSVPVQPWRETVTKAVRDLLRRGSYKPTGRGKPASEYLVAAFSEQRFPRINGLVDLANIVSLESALPISLLDLGRTTDHCFLVRQGHVGEKYVFNSAGQEIELQDLLLVAEEGTGIACGNPVKDSLRTKLSPHADSVLAVIYAPNTERERLQRTTSLLESHLRLHAQAKFVRSFLIQS